MPPGRQPVRLLTDAPPKRRSAASLVREYVRKAIFQGALRPGDKIPQGDIAEALSLSRIPVREALVALEREGVITNIPNRGAFVAAFDADAVEDHYELYGLIYGHAARRSTERAKPRERERLSALRAKLFHVEGAAAMMELTGTFLDILQQGGGSPRLRQLIGSLAGIVPGNFFAEIPGAMAVARQWMPLIVEAVLAHKADEAAASCLSMMRAQGKNVIELLLERGVLNPSSPSEEP